MKQHIYAALASKRRRLGMSQQELAARAGLRREKVNRMESRGEDVGLEDLCRLLDALGLELQLAEKAPEERAPRASAPRRIREAAFLDGSKARVVRWGKLPG